MNEDCTCTVRVHSVAGVLFVIGRARFYDTVEAQTKQISSSSLISLISMKARHF